MKMGYLLASSPERPEMALLHSMAMEDLRRGNEVYVYLVDDGVRNQGSGPMEELRKKGAHLFVCAYGAQKRNLPLNVDQAVPCGLTVLVDIMEHCDTFLALTPGSDPSAQPQVRPKNGVTAVLVRVSEDPRQSHRPSEAVRIAAGIIGWGKAKTHLLLHGTASRILTSWPQELVDGENFRLHLPSLGEKGTIYLASDAESHEGIKESGIPCIKCDSTSLKELQLEGAYLIPF